MSVEPLTVDSLNIESGTSDSDAGVPVTVTRRAPTVGDLGGTTRISEVARGSSLRGADMTMTNAANVHTAVADWEINTLSLATMPEPTLEELSVLDFSVLDFSVLDFSGLDTFDDTPVGTRYARCSDGNGTLSYLFFSDDDFDIARAKAICSKCGLREACLAGALERGEVAGVWGGELVEDGAVVVLKRRRGRPPKVARPVLVVDEVPVPPHMVA
jgi:WhiB family transcriptional regulator, redox-sensing transcriptional regulator